MLLEKLREIVWKCNLELPKNGLVKMTSGNVSERDPETGLVVIKPSGCSFAALGQPIPVYLTTCAMLGSEIPLGGYAPISGL